RGPDTATGMARSDTAALEARRDEEVRRVLADASAAGSWWHKLLPTPAEPGSLGGARVVRASVPLSASGLGERALGEIEKALAPFGMQALAGAGGGRPPRAGGPADFRAGEAIGIELVRGDMSMVGTGTVTYVDGKTVAAFGHPMFGAGE